MWRNFISWNYFITLTSVLFDLNFNYVCLAFIQSSYVFFVHVRTEITPLWFFSNDELVLILKRRNLEICEHSSFNYWRNCLNSRPYKRTGDQFWRWTGRARKDRATFFGVFWEIFGLFGKNPKYRPPFYTGGVYN